MRRLLRPALITLLWALLALLWALFALRLRTRLLALRRTFLRLWTLRALWRSCLQSGALLGTHFLGTGLRPAPLPLGLRECTARRLALRLG